MDIDFIVQVSIDNLDKFLDKLAIGGLIVDKNRIKNQLASGYNIISLQHSRAPYPVDLIIQTEGKMEKRPGTALGLRSYYQPPELLILSKLQMIKATRPVERSFKDREDIRQIFANTKVNKRKVLAQARKQGTISIFREILSENKEALVRVRDKIQRPQIRREDTSREVKAVRARHLSRVQEARSPKLSDIAGRKTISKEDWQRAQAVIRNAEAKTRKQLQKKLS